MSVVIRSNLVSNRRLREAFLEEQRAGRVDAALVAIRMGWENSGRWGKAPDTTRVRRRLGLTPETAKGQGKGQYRRYLEREKAEQLCRAIGLDPHEVGL